MTAHPLPCPFCGLPPKVANGKVKCTNLQCPVQPKTKAWYVDSVSASAVADWNERDGKHIGHYDRRQT